MRQTPVIARVFRGFPNGLPPAIQPLRTKRSGVRIPYAVPKIPIPNRVSGFLLCAVMVRNPAGWDWRRSAVSRPIAACGVSSYAVPSVKTLEITTISRVFSYAKTSAFSVRKWQIAHFWPTFDAQLGFRFPYFPFAFPCRLRRPSRRRTVFATKNVVIVLKGQARTTTSLRLHFEEIFKHYAFSILFFSFSMS